MQINVPQLPVDSLMRIKHYAKKLKDREIAPRLAGEAHTDEQIWLGRIGREIGRVNVENDINRDVRRGNSTGLTMSFNPTALQCEITGLTQEEIASINGSLTQNHKDKLYALSHVFRQLEILSTNLDFDFDSFENQARILSRNG